MELQQAMGQQERELRARQSTQPALYLQPRVLSADDVNCKHQMKGVKAWGVPAERAPRVCQPLLQVQARQDHQSPARARC